MPHYIVRRMSPASRLLQHWKDQEKWYVPWVDDVRFARRTKPTPKPKRVKQ